MTELEFLKSKGLIKEGFTEFIISGDFGKVELTELLKEYKTEQLRLHVVSQQRELLAFRKWQKDNWKDVYLYSDEFMISEFKKANCG